MVKHFCDRCKQEIGYLILSGARVMNNRKSKSIKELAAFTSSANPELCETCYELLQAVLRRFFDAKT